MSALTHKTIRELADLLASGQVSSRELTQAYINQVNAQEPALHAFLHFNADSALAQAEQSASTASYSPLNYYITWKIRE